MLVAPVLGIEVRTTKEAKLVAYAASFNQLLEGEVGGVSGHSGSMVAQPRCGWDACALSRAASDGTTLDARPPASGQSGFRSPTTNAIRSDYREQTWRSLHRYSQVATNQRIGLSSGRMLHPFVPAPPKRPEYALIAMVASHPGPATSMTQTG